MYFLVSLHSPENKAKIYVALEFIFFFLSNNLERWLQFENFNNLNGHKRALLGHKLRIVKRLNDDAITDFEHDAQSRSKYHLLLRTGSLTINKSDLEERMVGKDVATYLNKFVEDN